MNDESYMRLAVKLARKGSGYVNPNPMVGAVIVKDGRIIGQGYHERYGELHAERNALRNCGESPRGATIYVTLEPCCHYGKTPPCTEALIENGISRVVVGALDPNPRMSGKSIALLREQGMEVETGILEKECCELIRVFSKYITTGMPYVLMKYAMTMDGKIATYTGASQWITGEEARMRVQRTRHEMGAIMTGINTVLQDDPLLTCRLKGGKNPVRVICDTNLRTPLDSRIVRTAREVPTILVTGSRKTDDVKPYEDRGCEIWQAETRNGRLDLREIMVRLGERKIDSVLLEGGGTLNESALRQQIVDRVETYIAPKIFGGCGKSPVEGRGVALPDESYRLVNTAVTRIGEDILIESDVMYSCLQES